MEDEQWSAHYCGAVLCSTQQRSGLIEQWVGRLLVGRLLQSSPVTLVGLQSCVLLVLQVEDDGLTLQPLALSVGCCSQRAPTYPL